MSTLTKCLWYFYTEGNISKDFRNSVKQLKYFSPFIKITEYRDQFYVTCLSVRPSTKRFSSSRDTRVLYNVYAL
jgi:hypothetical protein